MLMHRLRATSFLFLLLSAISLAFPSPRLQAQTPLFFDELGAGPRATAMGQAFTAVADDPSAAYYNPAGLVQIQTPLFLTMGYQYAKPKVWVKMEPAELNLRQDDFNQTEDLSSRGLYVGFASNLGEASYFEDIPIANRVSFGVSIFLNLPEINEFWNPQWDTDPYVLRYNKRWVLLSMAISVAFQCTDWLSVGVGFLPRLDAYQLTTGSWFEVPGTKGQPADFRMNLQEKTVMGAVPLFGILFHPPHKSLKDKVSIGFSFKARNWGFYGSGKQAVKAVWVADPDNPILLPPPFSDHEGSMVINHVGWNPEQLTGAIALKPMPRLTIAFDLTWKGYSAFTFFWDEPPEPLFRDVWIPRVGLIYSLNPDFHGKFLKGISEITLLAGYYREQSPVPDMSGRMNILDSDQNVFSAGIEAQRDIAWGQYLKLQTFFQAHLFEENYIQNDGDPLFGPVSFGGQTWAFGIALSYVY